MTGWGPSRKVDKHSKKKAFFIDEIHRLNSLVEEYMYSAMEDFQLEIMIDSGPVLVACN
ncbi:MAG: hypothetical protein CM1200mP10_04630 [Candidatus Neomarinimicrobiota bacterium]|nr:MAG: hypothetical protein CM1200mP10_04630 [Candidatus Neomarinimicrobiota bacterium]